MERLWAYTQDPDLHERWDLRFTSIDYQPPPDPGQPQRFTYTTRLGFGISVVGEGETVGERVRADGGHTSALRFWSRQARSLIREGRGYWKYAPTATGVQFVTSYDYTTRYGMAGRIVDRVLFRPLMGWATAWSFDRLRLWLERGIDPGQAARQAAAHGLARIGLAAIFAWHGIVPKLLGPDPVEVELMAAPGLPADLIPGAIVLLGLAEVAVAIVLLATWHRAWPVIGTGAWALGALAVVAVTAPATLTGAFNPVTLNLAVAVLSVIDRLTLDGIPSAARCRRRPAAGMAVEPAASAA